MKRKLPQESWELLTHSIVGQPSKNLRPTASTRAPLSEARGTHTLKERSRARCELHKSRPWRQRNSVRTPTLPLALVSHLCCVLRGKRTYKIPNSHRHREESQL